MDSSESPPPRDQGHPIEGSATSDHAQLHSDGSGASLAGRLLFETPQRQMGLRTALSTGAVRGHRQRQLSPSGSDASSVTSYALRKSVAAVPDVYLHQISKWQRDSERHNQLIDTDLSKMKLANRKVEGRLSVVEGQCSAFSDLLHSQLGQSNSRISELQAQLEDALHTARAGLERKLKDVALASRASTAELEETVRRQGQLAQDLEAAVDHVLQGHASQHDEIRLSLEDLHARLHQLELQGPGDRHMSRPEPFHLSSQMPGARDSQTPELEQHPAIVALHERLTAADERFEQLTLNSHDLHERVEGHMVDLKHLRAHIEARDANSRKQEVRKSMFPDIGHHPEHLMEPLEGISRKLLEQHHRHGRLHDSMFAGVEAPAVESGMAVTDVLQLAERVARLEEQMEGLQQAATRTVDRLHVQGDQVQ